MELARVMRETTTQQKGLNMFDQWFSDYDNTSGFLAVRDALAPLGFEDSTWSNDLCPSLIWWHPDDHERDDHENGIRVWVDYYDPNKREVCDDQTPDVWISFGGFSHPFRSWADLADIAAHCRLAQEVARQ